MMNRDIEKSTVTRHLLAFSLTFAFMIVFSHVLRKDWDLIFKKNLYEYDESVQSVVSANLTRRFFPPMVRLNPLIEYQQIVIRDGRKKSFWMEGPQWQHIPPLFAYVPVPFFHLDKQISIEMRRFSYELVVLLTGLIFVLTVYAFEKTITAAISAAVAAVLWVYTPFTRQLVTGLQFGISNIVLAFTVICSFSALCWYLSKPLEVRKAYSYRRLIFITLVVSLPIMAKNVLGAIPSVTFFALLLYDHRKINLRIIVAAAAFLVFLIAYYGPLYLSSPETFMVEFCLSFKLFSSNFEGWQRPWHIFLSHYLPQFYLGKSWYLYVVAMLLGILALVTGRFKGKSRMILSLSIIWFFWNLLAVSISVSKAPDFIYQTYLLSLFFTIHSLFLILTKPLPSKPPSPTLKKVLGSRISLCTAAFLLVVTVFFTTTAYARIIKSIKETRAQPYNYEDLWEKFYRFGEIARQNGADTQDIFVLDASKYDYLFRYYIIFLTGAEAVTITNIMPFDVGPDYLKTKYARLHFVFDKNRRIPDFLTAYKGFDCPNFTVVSIDLTSTDLAALQRNISIFIDKSARDKNTLDLYDLKNNYAFIKIIVPAVYKGLVEKCEDSLSRYLSPYAARERFSLIDYRCQKLEPNKYKLDFLFHVNKTFEKGWQMSVLGNVKEQHLYLLSEEEQKVQAKSWWLTPIPPLTAWWADQYIMISEIIEAEPIPYHLKLAFVEPNRNISTIIDLGWVDLAALPMWPPLTDNGERKTTSPAQPDNSNL